jgi:hypothetical protein
MSLCPFRPLLLSSLVAHPSPSTAHPRQRPCLSRSSLLAGPPLPPPRPRGELRLPGFSAQFPLCSSPTLHVRCCRSSPTSLLTPSLVRTPLRVASPGRPLGPVVAPPPRCVPAGSALPATSPSYRMSCPRQIPRTSLPGWTPPAMPARRRARGHCAVTTGGACASRRARADRAAWLLGRVAGHRAPLHCARGLNVKPGAMRPFLSFSNLFNS